MAYVCSKPYHLGLYKCTPWCTPWCYTMTHVPERTSVVKWYMTVFSSLSNLKWGKLLKHVTLQDNMLTCYLVLKILQWLPIAFRIKFKILNVIFGFLPYSTTSPCTSLPPSSYSATLASLQVFEYAPGPSDMFLLYLDSVLHLPSLPL